MRQYRIRLVMVLLAFWLPLQAAAGLLTDCHLLMSQDMHDSVTASAYPTPDTDATDDEHCDGHPVAVTGSSSQPDEHQDHAGKLPCYHCTSVCHNLQVFVLAGVLTQHYPQDHLIPATKLTIPLNRTLETPQRPPRPVLFS